MEVKFNKKNNDVFAECCKKLKIGDVWWYKKIKARHSDLGIHACSYDTPVSSEKHSDLLKKSMADGKWYILRTTPHLCIGHAFNVRIHKGEFL